jgi:hypothetical protein
MKLLKLGLFSVLVLFIIVTLIGLLFPSKFIVSRTIDVAQSQDSVYTFTKDLFGWKKWVQGLQNQNVTSANETRIGNSTITILSSSKNKIAGKWTEKNGDIQTTTITLISTPQNQTIVNWQFEQDIKWYPWARLSSMVNETVIGKMMEDNLASLKKLLKS